MIGIISYGLGNINAFTNIYKSLDIPFNIVNDIEELEGVKKLILPGVGAFDDAMNKFNDSGLRTPIEKMVLKNIHLRKKNNTLLLKCGIEVALHRLVAIRNVSSH